MNEPDFPADISFLHLSDIHFRKGQMGDVHDADSDLRNELERDLRNVMATRVQRLNGIIISGDIAFAGQPEEFAFARGWIEKIRELVDCPKEGVMVTPGNHDVDRMAIPQNGGVDALHENVRAAGTLQERDAVIATILRHAENGPLIMLPMTAYNHFAENTVVRFPQRSPIGSAISRWVIVAFCVFEG